MAKALVMLAGNAETAALEPKSCINLRRSELFMVRFSSRKEVESDRTRLQSKPGVTSRRK